MGERGMREDERWGLVRGRRGSKEWAVRASGLSGHLEKEN